MRGTVRPYLRLHIGGVLAARLNSADISNLILAGHRAKRGRFWRKQAPRSFGPDLRRLDRPEPLADHFIAAGTAAPTPAAWRYLRRSIDSQNSSGAQTDVGAHLMSAGMPASTQARVSFNVRPKRATISSTCASVMMSGGQKAMVSWMERIIRPCSCAFSKR